MDRREFLKALVVALAVPAISSIPTVDPSKAWQSELDREASLRWSKFDPEARYGNAVAISDRMAVDVAKGLLLRDAKWVLPPGTPFYVLLREHLSPFEGYFNLYWFYSPRPLSEEQKKFMIGRTTA